MSAETVNVLIQNLSFGALFVVLFVWTLRENAKREQRYLNILDCYGKQLESIAGTLSKIEERFESLEERRGR